MAEVIEVNACQLARILRSNILLGISTFIWSDPGQGKSQIVDQVIASLPNWYQLYLDTTTLDPIDLVGCPYIEDKVTKMAVPEFFPRKEKVVIVIDEANRGKPSMTGPLIGAETSGRLAGVDLPKQRCFIAMSNATDQGTRDLGIAMYSRFQHLYFKNTVNDTIVYFDKIGMPSWLIAHLGNNPESLSKFDPKAKAQPNPRSWERVGKISLSGSYSTEDLLPVYAGMVGIAAAQVAWNTERLNLILPKIQDILSDPLGAKVPAEISQQYCIAVVVSRAMTVRSLLPCLQYLDRLQDTVSAIAIKLATTRDPVLSSAPELLPLAQKLGLARNGQLQFA